MKSTPPKLDQPRAGQQRYLAGPQFFGGIECQEHAGVAQRFGAGRLIELGGIYNIASATIALRVSLSSKATTSGG
jgi:hypothetical protein